MKYRVFTNAIKKFNPIRKKLILTGTLGVFLLGMTSCGHILCDAYKEADYTKYKKSENTQKVVLNIDLKKNK